MSPLCPTNLRSEYPLGLVTDQVFYNLDLDSMFFANVYRNQDYRDNQESNDDNVEPSESAQGISSTDQFDNTNPLLSKNFNHNASERERRKKINSMYSSLRALLPATYHKKKLSIPATVERMLEYIPELEKEVENLTHRKDVYVSKMSAIEGNAGEVIQEQKQMNCIAKETTPCSISASANKLGDNEMVMQISSMNRISISDMLLLLERNGYLVRDVSSFQSFGGTTFYNIHLWTEERNDVNLKKFEALMSLVQKQQILAQMQIQICGKTPQLQVYNI